MRDAQAGVPSAGWLWAQLAFKNSMVHGISAIHTKFSGILATSPAANRPRRRDPNTSPDHSIVGRSDGRCVQRAGDVVNAS
ncbi:hypothetical protein L1887_56120 [Cichorium endivia]|nr:hypothetical protein L1887_56120 [Cichorium endivia]